MTDRETLLSLARRCERATGPDRPISWDVWEAVGKPVIDDWSRNGTAPAYTDSLDQAMTLVPEGWEPIIDCRRKIEVQLETIAVDPETLDPRKVYATGATPALALCAASLRALATLDLDGEKA